MRKMLLAGVAALAVASATPAFADAREDLEAQGSEVCRQTLVRLAYIDKDANSSFQTVSKYDDKDLPRASMTVKRLWVQAFEGVVKWYAQSQEVMTLRKMNKCPSYPEMERDRADITEEKVHRFEAILVKAQIWLALAENGEGPWATR